MKKTVLIINNNGVINKILNDDFLVVENSNNFLNYIADDYYNNFFSFMCKLSQGNKVKNSNFLLKQNGKENLFFANAAKISNQNFVLILTQIIIRNDQTLNNIYLQYDLKIDPFEEVNVVNDFDEFSRLNNKLVNIQREFSRTNFELKNLNIQLKSVIESIQECLVLIDLSGEVIISNSNYDDYFDNKKNVFQLIENNNNYLYKKIEEYDKNSKGESYLELNDIKLKSYMSLYFDVKVVSIFNDVYEKKYFVITFDDVTNRMENIRRLRNLKMAFDQSQENIAITDTDFKIIFANQSFISEYGYSNEEDVLEKDIRKLTKKIKKPDKNTMIDREIFYNKSVSGEYFPVEISKTEVELGKEIISYIYFVKNISEQLEHEEKLILLAKKDQMTDTYSREAGLAYLKDFMSKQEKSTQAISILFIDINALKSVNDNFGHQIGDELIHEVVDAINQSTRTDDIIARLGGDEFLIILPASDSNNAEMIKRRIKDVTQNKNEQKNYLVSVSIGIASSKEIENQNIDDLMNLADHRMYEEKEKFYSEKEEKPR